MEHVGEKRIALRRSFFFLIGYHNNMYPTNRAVVVIRSAAAGEDILNYDVDDPDTST